ncbi:GPI inositol-deacylase PGAP1-like protein [Cinnamomum micranthum f. kanehirae]|uniref:GPI inositol-deacylase PGAP1-like protein n=1 Tax=Cinnamomum micranthum f. kanehirae TaxID=337451 RepID=A0A3S3P0H2_9MAGN|nr:GPI inositol-deacylase PGAP1-like protein [Cinnamomum micranthum f. kanehirae]
MTALFKINNNKLVLEEEEAVPKPKPPMWPMENVSPYFQSSGNPCLDFFNMLQYSPPETVRELLRRAWAHNPVNNPQAHPRSEKSGHRVGQGSLLHGGFVAPPKPTQKPWL